MPESKITGKVPLGSEITAMKLWNGKIFPLDLNG
jgi:hypothetical protein